jgi:hypothetical protein
VRLVWSDVQPAPAGLGPVAHVVPLADDGERYTRYSHAVRDVARPRLMENRMSYRLLAVEPGPTLIYGSTTFFEALDTGEALRHEFKAAWLAAGGSLPDWATMPMRTAVGERPDQLRRAVSSGISTLTIRRDRGGEHRFVLHERDSAAVALGGGLWSVIPTGEFQPCTAHPADVSNDFSTWHNIMRELSEEFLGHPEHGETTPRLIDYTENEPFRSFERARAAGRLRLWHYGVTLDSLSLAPTQRTVAVIDGEAFDELFAGLVTDNPEGRVIRLDGRVGAPFTAEAIERLAPRLSSGALISLELAWRDRARLLDRPS